MMRVGNGIFFGFIICVEGVVSDRVNRLLGREAKRWVFGMMAKKQKITYYA